MLSEDRSSTEQGEVLKIYGDLWNFKPAALRNPVHKCIGLNGRYRQMRNIVHRHRAIRCTVYHSRNCKIGLGLERIRLTTGCRHLGGAAAGCLHPVMVFHWRRNGNGATARSRGANRHPFCGVQHRTDAQHKSHDGYYNIAINLHHCRVSYNSYCFCQEKFRAAD